MTIETKVNKFLEERNKLAEKYNSNHDSAVAILEKEDATDEEIKQAENLKTEMDSQQEGIRSLEQKIDLYKSTLEGKRMQTTQIPTSATAAEQTETGSYRSKANDYLRSKGTKISSGLKFEGKDLVIPATEFQRSAGDTGMDTSVESPKVQQTIPVAQSYVPQRTPYNVVDMKEFTNVISATTSSGKQPILKNVTSKMVPVSELKKNPSMAEPEMTEVSWEVETYRQAIPLSQEAIDDSAIDLMSLVIQNAQQIKRNTTNAAISEAYQKFTPKKVTSLDDLKQLNNVDLDTAYQRQLVVSQSFYNILDTLKDSTGNYILQSDITSPTGKSVFGIPVALVGDELLGKKGEAHAFLGDTNRAVLFADRKDLTVRWVDSTVYGQYLQAAVRFGVTVADENAGFYLTWDNSKAAK